MHLLASERWSESPEIHVVVEAWVDKDESGGSVLEKKKRQSENGRDDDKCKIVFNLVGH